MKYVVLWGHVTISPLSQCLWWQVLLGWWHTPRSSHEHGCMNPIKVVAWVHMTNNTLCLHFRKNHGHQTRQTDESPWEGITLKGWWLFYPLINMRSCDNLKYSFHDFHKTYSHYIWQGANLRKEIQHTNT